MVIGGKKINGAESKRKEIRLKLSCRCRPADVPARWLTKWPSTNVAFVYGPVGDRGLGTRSGGVRHVMSRMLLR